LLISWFPGRYDLLLQINFHLPSYRAVFVMNFYHTIATILDIEAHMGIFNVGEWFM
jgi:hypothetical protein